jgi:hypothetical protein
MFVVASKETKALIAVLVILAESNFQEVGHGPGELLESTYLAGIVYVTALAAMFWLRVFVVSVGAVICDSNPLSHAGS